MKADVKTAYCGTHSSSMLQHHLNTFDTELTNNSLHEFTQLNVHLLLQHLIISRCVVFIQRLIINFNEVSTFVC